MRRAALLALAALAARASAQSPFQDARGESSLVFARGGYAQLAFDKSSARLGFIHDIDGARFFGLDLFGKLRGDGADLFGDGRLVDDARLQALLGWRLGKTLKQLTAKPEHDRYMNEQRKDSVGIKKAIAEKELEFLELDAVKLELELYKIELEAKGKRKSLEDDLKKVDDDIVKAKADPLAGALLQRLEAKRQTLVEDRAKYDTLRKYGEKSKGFSDAEKDAERVRLGKERLDLAAEEAKIDEKTKAFDEKIKKLGDQPYESFAIQVSGRAASYKLFDPDQPFDAQFRTKRFEGWSANAAFNGLLPGMRYGLSLGVKRDNNVDDDLTLTDLTERRTFTENGVTRTYDRKVSAYVGDYAEKTRVPFNADLIWWPETLGQRIAVNLYTRWDLNDGGSFRPGIGLFLSKPKAPTAFVGGLTVSLLRGKPQAAIIAGYSF